MPYKFKLSKMYLSWNKFNGTWPFQKMTFFEVSCKMPKKLVCHSASQGSSAMMVIINVAKPIKRALEWGAGRW